MDPNQQPTQNPNPNPWPNQTPAPEQTPDPASPLQSTPNEQPQLDTTPTPQVSFQPVRPEQPAQPDTPILQPEQPIQQLQPEPLAAQPEPQLNSFPQPEAQGPQAAPVEPQAFGQPVAPEQLSTQPQPASAAENPGKTLGIVSIILSLVGLGLVGLVVGILSRKKSKAANAPTTLGTVGAVLGGISTAAIVIVGIIITIFIGTSVNNVTDLQTNDNVNGLDAQVESVVQKAEIYNTKEGDYPKNLSEFKNYPETTLPEDLHVNSAVYTNMSPTYVYCEEGAAQVIYLGDSKDDKMITPLGTASVTEECARSL